MHFCNVDIPDELVRASQSGQLVVFAGAGVSMQDPVELPSFDVLVDEIRQCVDPNKRLRDRTFKEGSDGKPIYTETPEQYLEYLSSKKSNTRVRNACAAVLDAKGKTSSLHKNIVRLFGRQPLRIVTTNFDDCFENAIRESAVEAAVYCAPALPLGNDFEGLVHLHGIASECKTMVLAACDYGRAYVTDGWSSRFLTNLFTEYTVLFIGYSCGDSLVDYLTRSISTEMTGKAFTLCRSSEDTSDWQMRGVAPITFSKYDDLPEIIGGWADYLKQSVGQRLQSLEEIVSRPDLDQEQSELLVSLLTWPDAADREVFTKAFCDNSSCLEHLKLLKDKGLANFLMAERLSTAEFALLRWVIDEFALAQCGKLQALLFSCRDELSACFYERVFRRLWLACTPPSVIGAWLIWLESTSWRCQILCSQSLAQIASNCEDPHIVYTIARILLKAGLPLPNNRSTNFSNQEPVLGVGDECHRELLAEGIRRHAGTIGEKVFYYCCDQIEAAYSIQTSCWTNRSAIDHISYLCPSVEPHEQEAHFYSTGIALIRIARETIADSFADVAMEKCLESKCALLNRLGLWIMSEYRCDGNCLSLIEGGGYLTCPDLHHEVFQLMRKAFVAADSDQRKRFADYLKRLFPSVIPGSGYTCFNICSWLLEEAEDDELRAMRDNVLLVNPDFAESVHPDFINYMTACDFIDTSSGCEIDEPSFTVSELLGHLTNPLSISRRATPMDIVGVPSRKYPGKAAGLLASLLGESRSHDEDALCNLLIETIEWDSPQIERTVTMELLREALSNPSTCVSGVRALFRHTFTEGHSIEWTGGQLKEILLPLEANCNTLLEAESAICTGDEPDWLLIGEYHPAGNYIGLLCELSRLLNNEQVEGSHVEELLYRINPISLTESNASKAMIACFFARFNTWSETAPSYSAKAASALSEDGWVQLPAWQGMARLGSMGSAAWKLTVAHWDDLFNGGIRIERNLLDNLVRLYVRTTIALAEDDDRGSMLVECASESKESTAIACFQIGQWLKELSPKGRADAWDSWLSESFRYLASDVEGGDKTLVEVYCHWAEDYPDLTGKLTKALLRDGQNLETHNLVAPDVLESIAGEESVCEGEKANAIALLLDHQSFLFNEDDARRAVALLDLDSLGPEERRLLDDAYARKGIRSLI